MKAKARTEQLQRYAGNWATLEIMKSLLKNNRCYRRHMDIDGNGDDEEKDNGNQDDEEGDLDDKEGDLDEGVRDEEDRDGEEEDCDGEEEDHDGEEEDCDGEEEDCDGEEFDEGNRDDVDEERSGDKEKGFEEEWNQAIDGLAGMKRKSKPTESGRKTKRARV
jgi:hypothetical protein